MRSSLGAGEVVWLEGSHSERAPLGGNARGWLQKGAVVLPGPLKKAMKTGVCFGVKIRDFLRVRTGTAISECTSFFIPQEVKPSQWGH